MDSSGEPVSLPRCWKMARRSCGGEGCQRCRRNRLFEGVRARPRLQQSVRRFRIRFGIHLKFGRRSQCEFRREHEAPCESIVESRVIRSVFRSVPRGSWQSDEIGYGMASMRNADLRRWLLEVFD